MHFTRKPNGGVITILVKFDNSCVGQAAIQSSKYRTSCSNAVPITKNEAMVLALGKRGSEVTRLQSNLFCRHSFRIPHVHLPSIRTTPSWVGLIVYYKLFEHPKIEGVVQLIDYYNGENLQDKVMIYSAQCFMGIQY